MTTEDGNGRTEQTRDPAKPIVFDHLRIVRRKVMAGLREVGLLHRLVSGGMFDVTDLGHHFIDRPNFYICTMKVDLGLGVIQPLICVLCVGQGRYGDEGARVDKDLLATSIVSEVVQLHERRTEHAAKRGRIRDIAAAAVAEAVESGINMELMAVEALSYEPTYPPTERSYGFGVDLMLLIDREGRIEIGRQRLTAREEDAFARHLTEEVLPEQSRLMSKLRSGTIA